MTEDIETEDFEYRNGYDSIEEEVDKLNDLTFGDEIAWKYDNLSNENDDSSFERFPFDDLELKNGNENEPNDLLGLKGSFFNFGLFKPPCKGGDDFKIAMGKLDSLTVKDERKDIVIESPFAEIYKYSETLHQQFQDSKRCNSNSQFLNSIVSKHLDLLSKRLTELSLPMDVLAQIPYFRVLTTFVGIDNRVNEVRNKCASEPNAYNLEMASLAQLFAMQSHDQQKELSSIHPFYSDLMVCLRGEVPQMPLRNHRPQPPPPPSFSNDIDNGGWVTASERAWLTKVQTRNLVAENPYLHDYYYTVVKYRELAAVRDAQLSATGHTNLPDPITLLPSPITADQLGAGIDPIKDGVAGQYRPIQFENSLGVVTSANLSTPRPTIQVPPPYRTSLGGGSQCGCAGEYAPVRAHRELLGLIEKLHCTVLRVDEVDKSMAKMLVAQHPNRGVLLHHRSYLLTILMDCVNTNVRFVQLFSVTKGARVLASVMALVTSVQFLQLMRTFFFNCLSVWESDCFRLVEPDFRSIIISRIHTLHKDELSLLITTLFCNLTPKSLNDRSKLQPLSGFCRSEFGIHIVLSVLDVFFKISPGDKTNIYKLLDVAMQSSDSKATVAKIGKNYKVFQPILSAINNA